MSNPIKTEYDKMSIAKDIGERERIICQFQISGFFDRNDAIEKITCLQNTDVEIAASTKLKQAESSGINLYQADNNLIIANIQFQIDILKAKLAKLELEDKAKI